MQVFIIGSPLETAMSLSTRHLNNQVNEAKVILDALNGKKAWSKHPCTLQYKEHQEWLKLYLLCLKDYQRSCKSGMTEKEKYIYFLAARLFNRKSFETTPQFHTQEYFDQMKRRLYTKDNDHYKQWSNLGESENNWYFVENEWRIYKNGKRLQ